MNDKIKQLLENAEQSDAIAKNKWRIENREQLRKERKEKLKELMGKDKQQTAVEQLFVKMLDIQESCNQLTFDEYSELLNKYHEIEKNQAINFALDCHGMTTEQIEEHYIKTYGLYL